MKSVKWEVFQENSGDDEVGLLATERRSLDILSMKKEAKESVKELPEVEEGKGDVEDFRCRSLFTVCHRCLGFPETRKRDWSSTVSWMSG